MKVNSFDIFKWKNVWGHIEYLVFLQRVQSFKGPSGVHRQRQIISLLRFSTSSMNYLLSNVEQESDLFDVSLESLLDDERGFTLERLDERGQMILWKVASKSRDYSRSILTRWIRQVDFVQLVQLWSPWRFYETIEENVHIEKAFRYFLEDSTIRQRLIDQIRSILVNKK